MSRQPPNNPTIHSLKQLLSTSERTPFALVSSSGSDDISGARAVRKPSRNSSYLACLCASRSRSIEQRQACRIETQLTTKTNTRVIDGQQYLVVLLCLLSVEGLHQLAMLTLLEQRRDCVMCVSKRTKRHHSNKTDIRKCDETFDNCIPALRSGNVTIWKPVIIF
jgi:hypothetical protein